MSDEPSLKRDGLTQKFCEIRYIHKLRNTFYLVIFKYYSNA